jgi:ATP-dependent RNA helicase SUPV3L1/SUV3
VPKQHYTLAGYHPAGTRAIRIDMLERLADILRTKDSRAGFEAVPDMLSITGLSLEQFTDLMAGLGYKGERGERAKTKAAVAVVVPVIADGEVLNPIPEEVSLLAPVPEPDAESTEDMAPEMEVFYTYTWTPKPRVENRRPQNARPQNVRPQGERPQGERPQGDRPQGERRNDRPRGDRKPQGDKPQGENLQGEKPQGDRPQNDRPQQDRSKGDRPQHDRPQHDRPKGDRPQGDRGDRNKGKGGKPDARADNRPDRAKAFEARPPRVEKPIDPDNPFAVLMALKGKV